MNRSDRADCEDSQVKAFTNLPDMMDARFDVAVPAAPERKLLICAPPRTASKFLAHALKTAGIGLSTEYFGISCEQTYRLRSNLHTHMNAYKVGHDYYEKIIPVRTLDGLFVSTVQYWQLKRLMRAELTADLFRNAQAVFLTRNDLREQAISYAVSSLAKNWTDSQTHDTASLKFTDVQLEKVYLNSVNHIANEIRGFETFFALSDIEPVRLRSNDIIREPLDHIQQLSVIAGSKIKRMTDLHEFLCARGRYTQHDEIKKYLRDVIAPRFGGENEFLKTDGSSNPFQKLIRAYHNRKYRKSV